MHHTSISLVSAPLLSAQNGISLLKEISFLPQRREFLAAKKSGQDGKRGKTGLRTPFSRLSGRDAPTKPD